MNIVRALRLKGRTTAEDVAAATAVDVDAVLVELGALVATGDAVEQGGRYRLTPDGRDRLDELVTAESAGVDRSALLAEYERFTLLNARFKELASRWQATRDSAALGDLDGIDAELQELLAAIVTLAPRLAPYPGRFTAAIARVRAGEHDWFLRPVIDSYHTVWFECNASGYRCHRRSY